MRVDKLASHRDEIDESFGERLDWQRLEDRKTCCVQHEIDFGGWADQGRGPEIADVMIDAMIRLERVVGPQLKRARQTVFS